MSEALEREAALVAAAAAFDPLRGELAGTIAQLQDWLDAQTAGLAQHRLRLAQGMHADQPLSRTLASLDALLAAGAEGRARQWSALRSAQRLAEAFEDRIMLLVFGKFNAGKSSLCNLLAERFRAHGQAVQFFHLEDGRTVWSGQPLQEGATETTARLQGVCLGGGLVLLDTPGLHSVTAENAALTQRLTDSADAVLWLTSSTSPGQVQELDELGRELRRNKPLLAVITRSDVLEEDEQDGAIVKLLRNKTPANRALQQEDVQARARDKLAAMGLDAALLQPPVSVSAHAVRQQGSTAQALDDGGLAQLYAALLQFIVPARRYKQRKPAEVLLHHLEENVVGDGERRLLPLVSQLLDQLAQQRAALQDCQPRVAQAVWRQLVPELPGLLERHAPRRDRAALLRALAQELGAALAAQAPPWPAPAAPAPATIALADGIGYDADEGDDADGTTPVAVGYERLHQALLPALQQALQHGLEQMLAPRAQALAALEEAARALQAFVAGQHGRLLGVKAGLQDSAGRGRGKLLPATRQSDHYGGGLT